jgi:signal transduction histidine kinase/CheY-like chemotaxis protein
VRGLNAGLTAAFACLLALMPRLAVADAPAVRLDLPWQITSYLAESGIGRAHIFAIDFERNGTAWLATSTGLFRFDGSDWQRFTREHGLPSTFVRSVLVTRTGDIWVGTDTGAGVFDGRRFDPRGTDGRLAGPSVRRIIEDDDGTLWFCSDRWPDTRMPGGLTSLRAGIWRTYGRGYGLPHDHLLNYFRDSRGRQFALTIHSLSQRAGDRWGPPTDPGFPADPQTTWQMVELRDGSLVVQQWDRMVVLRDGRWRTYPYSRSPLVVTREGDLLAARINTARQTLRFERWTRASFAPASSDTADIHDTFLEMLRQAPDGSVWCVGQGMLLRWQYSDPRWTAFASLPPPQIVDRAGRVWFADDSAAVVRDGARFLPVAGATAPLTVDGAGAVWASAAGGLLEISGDDRRHHPFARIGVAAVENRVVDARGRLWIVGPGASGLTAVSWFDGTNWHARELTALRGYALPRSGADAEDGIWLALHRQGGADYAIVRASTAGIDRVPIGYPPPIERPYIATDRSHVWLYGYFGVFSSPRHDPRPWTDAQVPFGNPIAHLTLGDTLWIFCSGGFRGDIGVSGVAGDRWRHVAIDWQGIPSQGREEMVLVGGTGGFHLLRRDRDRDADFVSLPMAASVNGVVQEADGRYWLATTQGVLRYAPTSAPPRARVRTVVAEVRRDRSLPVVFAARRPFSAASIPDRFQYAWRLDDGPWTPFRGESEIAVKAAALANGRHTLALRARDGDGNASAPAVLSFTVLPIPLQERAWFWPAIALTGVLLVYMTAAVWRAKQRLALHAQELERKVQERTAALAATERSLQQASKMEALGTLAGGIAHDFNNILTGITGNAELAALDLPPEHPAQGAIGGVLAAARRARDLVGQILTFSRRRGEQQRMVLWLHEILSEALKLVRASLPTTIEIAVDMPLPAYPVLADPTQVHQVIMNLCTNAAQAMGGSGGGRLTVSLSAVTLDEAAAARTGGLRRGGYMRLRVSDTGCGMEPVVLERIFDPFFTTKGPGEGTGLGLAVVHGIMQSHNGTVTATSRPGEGSAFDAYFPVAEAAELPVAVALPAAAAPLPVGSGTPILLVDDDASLADVTARLLRRGGFVPTTYTDPVAALEAFRAAPSAYALVLTDLTMPRLSGLDLIRHIRAVRPDLPVIVGTGLGGTLDEREVAALGVTAIVPKPYVLRDLLSAINDAVRR